MPRKRYFHPAIEEEQVDFKWIGDGKKVQRLYQYTSCCLNGITVSVGDDVTVKQDDENLAVGTVLEFFEDTSDDPHRAKVTWYYSWHELPKRFQKLVGEAFEQELFIPSSEHSEVIDAETINGVCTVHKVSKEPLELELEPNVYYVRFRFGAAKGLEYVLEKMEADDKQNVKGTPLVTKDINVVVENTPKVRGRTKIEPKKELAGVFEEESKVIPKKAKRNHGQFNDRKGDHVSSKKSQKSPLTTEKWKKFDTNEAVTFMLDNESLPSDSESIASTSSTRSTRSSRSVSSNIAPAKPIPVVKELKRAKDFNDNIKLELNASPVSPWMITSKSAMKLTAIKEKKNRTNAQTNRSSSRRKTVGSVVELESSSLENDSNSSSRKSKTKNTPRKAAIKRQKSTDKSPITATPKKGNGNAVGTPKTTRQRHRTSKAAAVSKEKDVYDFDSSEEVDDSSKYARRKSFQKVTSSIPKRKSITFKYGKGDSKNYEHDCDDENDRDYVVEKDCLHSDSEDEENEENGSFSDNSSVKSDESESENEVTFKRANRKTKGTKASFSKKDTSKKASKTPIKSKTILTPSIASRSAPRIMPKSPLEFARQRLHVSAVPDSLPCREQEFQDIYSFVEDRLQEDTGGCMYISGVPGTGKTATVHEVIHHLEEAADEGYGVQFKFVELNGMKLTDPNQVYATLLKNLTGQKATADHAADILEAKFSTPSPKKEHVVVLVDELDLLWTRKQNVLYNLFDWPTRKFSKLIILAVANTMDLPERIMMNRVSSRLGLTRMTFQPYTFKQLQEIVLSRIQGIDAFEEDALQLVARKVAAISGDARRCLDICRRAVEVAESVAADIKGVRKSLKGIVNMKHVEIALKEMFSSPKILALQNMSPLETMFMKAVISEFRRTGLEEALFFEVYDQFQSHCRLEGGFKPPNASIAFSVCNQLGSCRLLLTEAGHKDVYQRIRMNVSVDDVMFALRTSNTKT